MTPSTTPTCSGPSGAVGGTSGRRPASVPAARVLHRGQDAAAAGQRRDRRGLRGRRRGCPRGAVEDRQRRPGRPADAVPARGGRQAGHAGAALLRRRRRGRGAGPGPVPGWPNRSPTCSSRCGTPTCSWPRRRSTTRPRSPGPCSSTPSTRPWPAPSCGTWSPPTRRCGSPATGSSAAQWPGCRPTPPPSPTAPATSWSTWPPSTRSRRPRRPPGLGRRLRRRPPPGRRRRLRQLPCRRGARRSATPTTRPQDRLVEVKRRFGPDNLFHRNQNIRRHDRTRGERCRGRAEAPRPPARPAAPAPFAGGRTPPSGSPGAAGSGPGHGASGGAPHAVPVFAVWSESALFVCSKDTARKSPQPRRRRPLCRHHRHQRPAHDRGGHGPAGARRPTLRRASGAFKASYDWPTVVAGDQLDAEYGAPTSGSPRTTSTRSPPPRRSPSPPTARPPPRPRWRAPARDNGRPHGP